MRIDWIPANCQGNYAVTVRRIMPLRRYSASTSFPQVGCGNVSGYMDLRQKARLPMTPYGIIELTDHWTKLGGSYDDDHRCQVGRASAARRSPSSSRTDRRFAVSRSRLFRSTRSRPSPIRDAAAGSSRRCLGNGRRRGVRLFAVRVLRSQRRLSAWRIAGLGPSPARSSAPAQVEWTDPGLPPRAAWPRSGVCCRGIDTIGSRSIWSECPSPQHRAGVGSPAKKGAVHSPATADAPGLWTTRYEDLRQRALTVGEAGWEQILVIRQGLQAWMNAWPQPRGPRPVSASTTPTTHGHPDPALTSHQQMQLVQILASIILHSQPEVPS